MRITSLVFASLMCACSSGSTVGNPAADDAGGDDAVVQDSAMSDAVASDSVGDSASPGVGRLKVEGDHIVDPDGKPIVLRGWNWGNWGSEQPNDAADNASQGANVVRIPVRWWGDYPADMNARDEVAADHYFVPARFEELKKTIADATDKHLWVVLFVDSNCGQASIEHTAGCGTGSDGLSANFMNDEASKQKFFEVWKFLAGYFRHKPYIGMYELLPEPNFGCKPGGGCPDWSLSNKFYSELLPLVRAVDANTPILVGPNGGYEIRQLESSFMPGTENVVYTGDLLQHAASDPSSVDLAVAFRKAHGVPLFIQQVGVPQSNTSANDIVNRVLGQLRDAQLGWTWWTYREPFGKGMGFAPYYGTPYQEDAAWLGLITSYFH